MKIVVLAGGLSTERDVSLTTGTMVTNALRSCGHQAVLVDVFFGVEELPSPVSDFFRVSGLLSPSPVKKAAPDIEKVRASRKDSGLGDIGKNVITLAKAADLVFLALHGDIGENGKLQAMFDMMHIKYTGSGYLGSALAMDKNISKQLFIQNNLLTPSGAVFQKENAEEAYDFPLPCIVKPCSGGSSVGITKAFSKEELKNALKEAFRYEDSILIEPFITGREFTCGVLGNTPLPPAEIIPKGDFYDYTHKYQDGYITEICPAKISQAQTEELQALALRAFEVLQLSVYARMDFILEETTGKFYLLEANTLPGLTPTSHMPQEALAVGIDYPTLCTKIIELSLQKYN